MQSPTTTSERAGGPTTTIPASPAQARGHTTNSSSSLDSQQQQQQITNLRARLKEWEKRFSLAHSGRKAGKEDIKADGPEGIGRVYKEYNRLRAAQSGGGEVEKQRTEGVALENEEQRKKRKRKRDGLGEGSQKVGGGYEASMMTPRKARQSQGHHHSAYDSPSSVTPRPLRAYIGPTPQRDGNVLGLFDLLSGGSKATPSTSTRKRKVDALSERTSNVLQTPSRKRGEVGQNHERCEEEPGEKHTGKRQRFERTPASEGKKFLLSQFFASPGAARFLAGGDEELETGERSVNKTPLRTRLLAGRGPVQMENIPETEEPAGPDSTPPFLRRSSSFNQRLLAVEKGTTSPVAARTGPNRLSLFKKGRSLSEIVKDLRKVQDEEHDDDLEALNEMESGDQDDEHQQPRPPQQQHISSSQQETHDISTTDAPEGLVDDDLHNNNNPPPPPPPPSRPWKKKGQKRTTRRVNMKPPSAPLKNKNKITTTAAPTDESSDNGSDSEDELAAADADFSLHHHSTKKSDEKAPQKKGRTIKANAVSQMNFRSLKIKNKNSRAKGRGFGRFGRR